MLDGYRLQAIHHLYFLQHIVMFAILTAITFQVSFVLATSRHISNTTTGLLALSPLPNVPKLTLQLPLDQTNIKRCVVLASNTYFLKCAHKLLGNIRTIGQYDQTLVLIMPTGTILKEADRIQLSELGVEVHFSNVWSDIQFHGSSAPWLRMYIFTDEYFRAFDVVLYMDSDGYVQHDLKPLFEMPSATTIVMRDNGIGINKNDLYSNEYSGMVPVQNTVSPGASTLFAVNMSRLENTTYLNDKLKRVLHRYRRFFKFADQSLINTVFRNEFQVIWPCTDKITVVSPDSVVSRGWARNLCAERDLIYVHDWQKKCLTH